MNGTVNGNGYKRLFGGYGKKFAAFIVAGLTIVGARKAGIELSPQDLDAIVNLAVAAIAGEAGVDAIRSLAELLASKKNAA